MSASNTSKTLLMTFGAVLALSGCGGGADRVASPGEGAFPPPPTTPPPPGPPPPPPPGTPPADCPAGFANVGTIANGSLRACQIPSLITGNLLVPNRTATVYAITGRVDVGQDQGGNAQAPTAAPRGVLTIESGVRLFGAQGLDYLVVNRGSQIFAEGNATSPIVFTSRQNLEGQTGPDSIGQWGGLVILGRAPINACPGTTVSGTPECQAQVEGTNAFYGGNFNADNSGRLRYVRVQYSGFEILPNNELNGITLAGVGNGTTISHVQVHNSSDDGIEWFGGSVNARYLVITGADDDGFDTDTAFNGAIQFGIVIQRASGGDRMNEFSSINRTPASNPKVANVTYVGRNTGGAGIVMNSGTNSQWYNIAMTKPAGGTGDGRACLDIDDANTTGSFNSVFFSCPIAFVDDSNVNAAAAAAIFNAGSNNTANGTSTLQNTFVNGPNESAVPAFANLPSISPFFQQVSHIGGVRDASDNWWQGWTCNLIAGTPC